MLSKLLIRQPVLERPRLKINLDQRNLSLKMSQLQRTPLNQLRPNNLIKKLSSRRSSSKLSRRRSKIRL